MDLEIGWYVQVRLPDVTHTLWMPVHPPAVATAGLFQFVVVTENARSKTLTEFAGCGAVVKYLKLHRRIKRARVPKLHPFLRVEYPRVSLTRDPRSLPENNDASLAIENA